MADAIRRLVNGSWWLNLRARPRRGWCSCGDSRRTGTHSAAECGPLPWGF